MQAAEIKARIGEAGAYLVQYPVRAFLDCSTAHLTEATRAWLDDVLQHDDSQRPIGPVGVMPDGWFCFAPAEIGDDDKERIPADLLAVLAYARSVRCEYVYFSADAAAIPELPTHEETEA